MTAPPYAYTWDTTKTSNGSHTLRAIAKDTSNNSATSASVAVTVNNLVPDTTPPVVTMTAPANGATVSGTVGVSANATDNVAVASVQFQLDGANLGAAVTAPSYAYSWDTTKTSNGAHTLRAIAKDTSNNSTTSAGITVTVNNTTPDTTPPTVNITAPANNATVSSTITLTATATDPDSAVSFVQFRVDGAKAGAQLATPPYSISLDTTTLSNGNHTLTALAQDPSANQGTSTPVTITVSNSANPPPSSGAITLVQQAELSVGSGSTSTSLSFPSASASGDLILATVKWGGQNFSVASITDNKGNLYQSALGPTNWSGTAKCAQTFAARNIAGGGVPIVITVHLTGGSTSNLHLYQFEYSGADANAPLDAGSTATGSGATLSSGTLTTRYGNELIHAVAFTGTGTTIPGTGFHAVTTYAGNLVETETATAVGTYHATASDTVSADWFIHALTIKAAGSGTAPPDTTPPVVNITAPANGATVSGTITLTATASDPDSAVSFVQFLLDGVNSGTQFTAAPYSYSLDTTTLSNATHSLTAVAQDPSGNVGTSAAVTITVSNTTTTGMGPLKQSAANSNYFVTPSGKAVLLSGSHTWDDFQDTDMSASPAAFDFNAYVSFLKSHGHSATILWRKDLPTYCNWGAGGTWNMSPFPWKRTGGSSGTQLASDGLPAFDLAQLDQTYFDRLRSRVIQLQQNGIYGIVELFDGLGITVNRCSIDGYPFTGGNNINGVDDGGGTNSMTMTSSNSITGYQDAYVQKVIDTLNDLPNVLWEISEEAPSNSGWWEGHMIDLIHTYEAGKPFQHPVGLPMYNAGDSVLYDSNADWVAPGARISSTSSCGTGTPACKVNINDSDHSYFGLWNDSAQTNRNYVWENFANGNQVMFMDPYLIYWTSGSRNLCQSPSNGVCTGPDTRWNNLRDNLGYIVNYANKMDLLKMTPQGNLSSTGFCLADNVATGAEYLVYAPNGGSFTVDLSATTRTLNVEWFDPSTGATTSVGTVSAGSTMTFTPPFGGDAVLYLVDAAGHN